MFQRPSWRGRLASALAALTAGLMLVGMWPAAGRWLPPLPMSNPDGQDVRVLPGFPAPLVTPLPAAAQTTAAPAGSPPRPSSNADAPPMPGGGQTYRTQAGDTLAVLAVRFGVDADAIRTLDGEPLPAQGFLSPGQEVWIPPGAATGDTPGLRLLPDSEVVYSPATVDFDPVAFVQTAGGALATYEEYLPTPGTLRGGALVAYIAHNYSLNPRLLLALLEYRGGWVFGQPQGEARDAPLRRADSDARGRVSRALVWAAQQLADGYYGWREGRLTELAFPDGSRKRLAPTLNAGTVAVMYFFAQLLPPDAWARTLAPDNPQGFPAFYAATFGDPWERARWAEPLYPPDLQQPAFILPFARGQWWSLTSGPHGAYGPAGSLAALDLAPAREGGARCRVSRYWVLAVADGVVVRSEPGVVVLDLDGDGREQTGWNVLYLHIASEERRVRVGYRVHQGDPLGHPSCEGGVSTGTHIHLARKYNGEWMAAAGPVPFDLGGWVAQAGAQPYQGRLVRGDDIVVANPLGTPASLLTRGPDDP